MGLSRPRAVLHFFFFFSPCCMRKYVKASCFVSWLTPKMAETKIDYVIAIPTFIGSLLSFLASAVAIVLQIARPPRRHFRHALIVNLLISGNQISVVPSENETLDANSSYFLDHQIVSTVWETPSRAQYSYIWATRLAILLPRLPRALRAATSISSVCRRSISTFSLFP